MLPWRPPSLNYFGIYASLKQAHDITDTSNWKRRVFFIPIAKRLALSCQHCLLPAVLDSLSHIKNHETFQKDYDDAFNNDWQDEVAISDKYKDYCPELSILPDRVADMWDEYVVRIATRNCRVDLTEESVCPVHNAPYRADQAARKFAVTGNWWDTTRRSHWTSSNRKLKLTFLCVGERWLALVWCWLLQTKHRDDPRLVSASQNGRVYRFMRWQSHVLDPTCHLRIFESRNQWTRSLNNHL